MEEASQVRSDTQQLVGSLADSLQLIVGDLWLICLGVLLLGLVTIVVMEIVKNALLLRFAFQFVILSSWIKANSKNLKDFANILESLCKFESKADGSIEPLVAWIFRVLLHAKLVTEHPDNSKLMVAEISHLREEIEKYIVEHSGLLSLSCRALYGRDFPFRSVSLPIDQLSAQLANIAQTSQDRPSEHLLRFLIFSDGIDRRDQLVVLVADLFRRHFPDLRLDEQISDEVKPEKHELISVAVLSEAQEAISLQVDSNLDSFQLGLNQGLVAIQRQAAFLVSFGISFWLIAVEHAVKLSTKSGIVISLVLALIASYIVTLLYSLVSALGTSRLLR